MGAVISILKLRQGVILGALVAFHVAGLVGKVTNNGPVWLNNALNLVGGGKDPKFVSQVVGELFDSVCESAIYLTGTAAWLCPNLWEDIKRIMAGIRDRMGITFTKLTSGIVACFLMFGCAAIGKGAKGFNEGLKEDAARGKEVINAAANKVQELSSGTLNMLGAPLAQPPAPTPTPRPVPASDLLPKRYIPLFPEK